MKKITIFSTVFFMLFLANAHATVRRVNNNAGVNNNTTAGNFYTTLLAAYTASSATAGDTIIVEPSATQYDALGNITKKIVIIGNGGGAWLPANTQLVASNSQIGSLSFNTGSQGSYISGLSVYSGITINTNDITIQRCYCDGNIGFSANTQNTIIKECFIYNIISSNSYNNTGLVIQNNIIRQGGILLSSSDNGIIENNTFNAWNVNYGICDLGLANVMFNNNIFRGISNFTAASLNNNICMACTTLPASNGNQNSVTFASLFVPTAPASTDADIIYQPKAGSAALDAGFYGNGDDIGAFNNGTGRPTYKQGYVPNFPSIYLMNPGAINGNTMNVTISTKANN
jgi:hypothetical protein